VQGQTEDRQGIKECWDLGLMLNGEKTRVLDAREEFQFSWV
jgi:hypothetical protein